MKISVIQSNYWPWKGYFDIINECDLFVFYDEVKYTKNDWRNRNILKSSNGSFWLTIPIAKDAVNLKINQVKLSDNKWVEKHYKTIINTYQKAPHFNQLLPLLEKIYLQNSWSTLSELNQYIVKIVCDYLSIKTKIISSTDNNYPSSTDRVERLLNLLTYLGATEYITGPTATYLDTHFDLFVQKGIKLTVKDYSKYASYTQMSEPFSHGVSILDVIANVEQKDIARIIFTNN